jgi:hypothetical protein
MFVAFMLSCIYFCTYVLLSIYSASRKCSFSLKFHLDLNSFKTGFANESTKVLFLKSLWFKF